MGQQKRVLSAVILGQKLVDSADSTGLVWTRLGLFYELRVFQHFLFADSTNFGTKACRLG